MRRLGGALFFVTALLTACSGTDTEKAVDQGQESSTADFNDADVLFLQMMIPHHEQAVEMAELATDRAASPEVKELAAQIEQAQAPEIETMTGWLEDWGESVDMGGMDMREMDGMQGMLSDEQMASLEAASGAEFDELFLTRMREHHLGAVMMAEEELEAGEFADAKALAQTIIDTQQAEIERIDELLEG